MKDLSRLSLNQITIKKWTLREAIEGCARHGIPYIGVWRDKLAEQTVAQTNKQLQDAGVKVSSVCRGGFFSAPTAQGRMEAIDQNRRAIDECAAIGSPVLVLVAGPANGQALSQARGTVRDAIEALLPYAAAAGVTLGIEPLHPMYAAERSVVVSLRQANDLVESFGVKNVGIIADVFHLWWDPEVEAELKRSGNRIVGFHVSDWLVPLPDMLLGRGVMGDGVIEIRKLRELVHCIGYRGPIEVEIFNQALWNMQPATALERVCQSYLDHV